MLLEVPMIWLRLDPAYPGLVELLLVIAKSQHQRSRLVVSCRFGIFGKMKKAEVRSMCKFHQHIAHWICFSWEMPSNTYCKPCARRCGSPWATGPQQRCSSENYLKAIGRRHEVQTSSWCGETDPHNQTKVHTNRFGVERRSWLFPAGNLG